MKPVLLFLFNIIFYCCSAAQPHYFRHYQVENGLSNNTVYCCLQDKKGFMWFGTKDGLNRFDGYNFKIFRHNINDERSVSNNLINALHLDNEGNLWVGTDRGLDKYNPETENFSHVATKYKSAITSITSDKRHNCWFICGTSLIRYNEQSHQVSDFASAQHFNATSLTYTDDGTLWVSSSVGTLEKLDTLTRKFSSYSLFKNSKKVASNHIVKIYNAGNNTIFAGTTNQGSKLFNCATGTYKDILTYNKDKTEIYVRDFVKYADNEFWIATESGVYIYNPQKNTFVNLRKHYNDPYSISDNAVYTLCKDMEGGIWAGTFFGGANYYAKPYATFNKFYPGAGKNAIVGNVVREICKDQFGNLWLGTEDNGINKLSADKNSWTHYTTGTKNGLANTNIHGILANGRELFIGTFERGLDILDIPSGKIVRRYLAGKGKNDLKSNFVICFYKTRSNVILIGTTIGLYQYNPAEKNFSVIDKIPANAFVYSLCEDHNGKLWIGTVHEGIYCYDFKTNTGHKFDDPNLINTELNNATINGLFEDSDKNMWFLTEGNGLWRYNPVKKNYKLYNSKNGLLSNYVFKILEDENKNLWISTSRGLVCLNIDTENISVYTKANGLLSDQFNYNSAFKDADNTMYFGCVKGMVSFNPAQFTKNRFKAPVYLTGFQVNNQEVFINAKEALLKKSIIATHQIDLDYKHASFSIDFAALSYSSPEMTQYKYIMIGLDKGWTYLKTNRKVYFTQLSPGRYIFKVKAAHNNGDWNASGTKLIINISPPFWKSFWAYATYAILILCFFYALLKRYHLKIGEKNKRAMELMENDKEKQIYNAKIDFFTNVAHEIRTPLTLIKGPMEKVIKKAESVPEIHHNLKIMEKNTNRLLDLTNQLLDFRKTETNGFSLDFTKIDITELLADTFLQFKLLAEQKNLSYNLIYPDKHVFAFVDTEAFTKILTNLLNNAVKYAATIVQVTLFPVDEIDHTFTIQLKNDGSLIPEPLKQKIFEPFFRLKESEKQVGTGIGLSISRSLAELHDGKLLLAENDESSLNVFALVLPVRPNTDYRNTL